MAPPPPSSWALFRVSEWVRGPYENLHCRGDTYWYPAPANSPETINKHVLDWNFRASPFVSTSSSLLWAIWEAGRRVIKEHKDPNSVRIVVIDSRLLESNSILRLTEDPLYSALNAEAQDFVEISSEVLVKGHIPHGSIVTEICWVDMSDRLPSFFNINAELKEWEKVGEELRRRWGYGTYLSRYDDCRRRCQETGRAETYREIEEFLRYFWRPQTGRWSDLVPKLTEHLLDHLIPEEPEPCNDPYDELTRRIAEVLRHT
ncbi:hypothetical protein Moror_9679 [Moniliophthora roreri MCA 2997]|uniref:DUF7587 domain-containing protein n=2 Tax=Moniliophthora roreri TaxID=221103 RepID=V2X2L8_MONRO|nr:hypothetical protein Moror_9679 [Moniliophthora roreri MCA 2997]